MDYTIYAPASGQILRTMRLPDAAGEPAVADTEALLEGRYSGRTYYVADGAPVAFPENPDPAYEWDWDAKAWVDPRTDTEVADAAKEAVRVKRNTVMDGGIVFMNLPMKTDEYSRSLVTNEVTYIGGLSDAQVSAYSLNFKFADGQYQALDFAGVMAFFYAMRQHVSDCFAREAELVAAIDSGGSYDIDAGWPSNTENMVLRDT
ncbi:DUF4376 domain-containing protein [Thioclava litoralis]|uniref:DUF4376 domain-containing protein n=1 Tax=Thioclava litoralis TaxID=3076557 RepID=A0ABZ1DY03_9RHOB|nr:DUF4376 domain-containing protein [Thioclava sp. FTW29]